MFGIAFYVFDTSGNPQAAAGNVLITVEYTRPDGTTFYQRHQIPAQAIQPFDQNAQDPTTTKVSAPYYSYFAPLNPNRLYPPKTTVTFDISDLPNYATSLVQIVLLGTKVFRSGEVWSPTYPAKYSALPFDYAVQIPAATLPTLNYPFTIQPDADFVWQKGAQTSQGGTTLIIQPAPESSQGTLVFTATAAGIVAGVTVDVSFPGAGGPNPLSISVIGGAVTVNLAQNASNQLISNGTDVVALWNATPAAVALAMISFTPTLGPVSPFNNTAGAFAVGAVGALKGMGIRIRDVWGKAYMNDYIPAELIFGFDNAQTPGLVYPEIYIPRLQQLSIDVAGTPNAGILTLSFKGMKVYGQ
jgi:hypothetical protein